MVRDRKGKGKSTSAVRRPERRTDLTELHERERELLFDELPEDPGNDDYIWPECGLEDEDEL